MEKIVLSNGLPVFVSCRPGSTAALLVCVGVGSCLDSKPGISHFVEHMVFEGTSSRSAFEITNAIEGIGGEIGAYTSVERTCFYAKVLPGDLAVAVDVLVDIMKNPLFDSKAIDKERNVILSEIKLKHDEPRFYQWELFMRSLFGKHPVSSPIIGTAGSVRSMAKDDLVSFFHRFYVASNMRVVYVGPKVDKDIFNRFSGIAYSSVRRNFANPPGFSRRSVLSRPIGQSYLVLGCKTVPRKHPDSFVLDVIRAILGKGLTGRIVNEVRQEKGLAYEVGCVSECDADYGFFSVYLSTKDIPLAESIVRRHLAGLESVSGRELLEAKNYCVGEFVRETEDSRAHADVVAFWDLCKADIDVTSYVKSIRAVAKKDVLAVSRKYFKGRFAVAVLKGR